MERLEKLINILKLTPHRQPELVKEATHRILSRSIRTNQQSNAHLRPLIEILILYCDTDDSVQRSLFNDHLNSVILAFHNQNYILILQVLVDVIVINGSARSVTAALQRIPHLINNVQPIELGCDPQKLLKAFIEVARRTEDESVLRALDSALKQLMPYLDYFVRKSKEMQLLANSLIEILSRNLQDDSSQVKRLAASSISAICSNSELLFQNTLSKFRAQLNLLLTEDKGDSQRANKFVGFCLCAREMPDLMRELHLLTFALIQQQLKSDTHDITMDTAALETLKDLLKYELGSIVIDECANLVANRFLFEEDNGKKVRREEVKVILQSNALACLASMIRQKPQLVDLSEYMLFFGHHSDYAIRNQVIIMIGNYINASWRFPMCVEQSVDCEKIRKLWVEIRAILNDDTSHPDVLKACVVAIKSCINLLLDSDHCLHIIEHHDFDSLIQIYLKSNFKPLKIEILNLFSRLNFRTLSYLEKCHWSSMKSQTAGSYIESLQDRIVNVMIGSLLDDNYRIRNAAASCLVTIIPNLYVTNVKNGHKNVFLRTNDPIVSLAHDFASEHLIVLKQVDEHVNHFSNDDGFSVASNLHEKLSIRSNHKFLSSSIIQSHDNPYNEQDTVKSQQKVNIAMNLMYIVGLLKFSMENGLERGKSAISSIVRTLYEMSLVYPVYQYSASWDCRPSEYCETFTLLNFLLTYMENLIEPDVVVDDLDAYKNFLALTHQLLYALCHESVINDYEHQKMKPFHKRQAETREGYWSELKIKHSCIAEILETYLVHLVKLLCSLSYIIEEKTNPFNNLSASKQSTPIKSSHLSDPSLNHRGLMSSGFLFARIYKKLESSLKSSRKNLNIRDEKFHQILDLCLCNLSSLLEFVGMQKSMEYVKEILNYLKISSQYCGSSSLVCARQLLKSLFGINILALYQVDPNDWFEENLWTSTGLPPSYETSAGPLQGVYYNLISNPYKIFSNYCSINFSKLTPSSDRALAIMNFESRRALKVRRRIEDRVKSLFEFNPQQLVSPKIRQISEILKNTITEFTPIVTDCMTQFGSKGFSLYQSETLHFMSYLILLRVNFQKLALANDLVDSINKLLDQCGEKVFRYRESSVEILLRNSFTLLTLLSHDREFCKSMFPVATVIQKLDDVRAKLSMNSASERDVTTYVVPLLRCLVEDLFIYRTKDFQNAFKRPEAELKGSIDGSMIEMTEQDRRDEILEAERETVAQKLIDVIDNPRVYDLLSILVQESRQNSSEIKYKKLSQHLLSIIPTMLVKRNINLVDYRCIELTRRIIENISPEVFNPVSFIIETLLEAPKPSSSQEPRSGIEFQRWMSLVIISMHILITQVKEEVFLNRLKESMSDESFVEYLLHIAQLCIAEIIENLYSPFSVTQDSRNSFLIQQLSSYILYLTRMFQSGLFFQLSRRAAEFIKKEVEQNRECSKPFKQLTKWARDSSNGFSLNACEQLFYHVRLVYPDLTISWCNVMMLLNNVDCNRDFWRDLLVYECHHCTVSDLCKAMESLNTDSVTDDVSLQPCEAGQFKRSAHINRPSSLNLSDISFSDQLRRSFIKRIAATETREKALNRNIVALNGNDGQLLERETNSGNTEQCLCPNIELTRRGALCLVLDFVTISMNDVEHITWLIIHHINDIIRWSHEMPITEFINSVHGNSASSGIFIQAINNGFNNLTSISFVSRVLWTLQQVHYTQYGSLVVLMIEKLLSSPELLPYRSVTRKIEDFACSTVQKLLNETNKSLATTNDEVINQLTVEDLDRIYALLDTDLYPRLTELLVKLRESSCGQVELPMIALQQAENLSDDDSDADEIEVLYAKSNLIYWLAEQNCTAHILSLIPALNTIKKSLADPMLIERVNKDELLVSHLISALYSLALNILPPPARLCRPSFWSSPESAGKEQKNESANVAVPSPPMSIVLGDSKRKTADTSNSDQRLLFPRNKSDITAGELTDTIRIACLKLLFLLDNLQFLRVSQYQHLEELVIRLSRLPLANSFLLTPPTLWRQNIWPIQISEQDIHKVNFPMVNHEILSKDPDLLDSFCERLLTLGWTSRRQFEEAWMTLLGVMSTTLSPIDVQELNSGALDLRRKSNLRVACKTITTITKLMLLNRKSIPGDPLSSDTYQAQDFEDRVIELTRSISTNLSSLRKRTKIIFEAIELERSLAHQKVKSDDSLVGSILMSDYSDTGFSDFLRISAQKIRMNVIINVESDLQDTVVIDSDSSGIKSDDIDVESCIRLLLSIYRQKLADPNDSLIQESPSKVAVAQQVLPNSSAMIKGQRQNQIPPPLITAICQSVLALSDMFSEYEQYEWMFENFVQMFKQAEKNEDEIQMQYLIVGLCKSASICCYDIPNELTSSSTINHKEVMFEKCRQTIEKCIKSDFGPSKRNALFGLFYMLEDSINIVASGAWELDQFKQLRQSRLSWIMKLMPIILDRENSKLLTKKVQIMQLLESLCEVVSIYETKLLRN